MSWYLVITPVKTLLTFLSTRLFFTGQNIAQTVPSKITTAVCSDSLLSADTEDSAKETYKVQNGIKDCIYELSKEADVQVDQP